MPLLHAADAAYGEVDRLAPGALVGRVLGPAARTPLQRRADRVDGGAQIATINADGTGFRELTKGPNNNGFPERST